MPALMVQGCTSWAGKSLIATALCRWFARRGVDVAPFKAQNMANNARVCAGGEIGAAQWLQARAARVEPTVGMNPVLLKPESDTGSQVVRLGRVDHQLSRMPWQDRSERLWPDVRESLDDLLAAHELVVIEGAGSPAEINLAAKDIVNMRVADHADAPVLLVADIDRGGAFAHLYGTWALLPQEQRTRLAGFVLNRFRGDASLLPPGPEDLERLTGVPTIGVMPMLAHDLPDEDGGHLHRAEAGREAAGDLPVVAVVRYPSASNLDEYTLLEQAARRALGPAPGRPRPRRPRRAARLQARGERPRLARDDRRRRRPSRASPAQAVACSGSAAGSRSWASGSSTSAGVDGTRPGLGLLPLVTTFERDKVVTVRAATFAGSLPAAVEPARGRRRRGLRDPARSHLAGHRRSVGVATARRGAPRRARLGVWQCPRCVPPRAARDSGHRRRADGTGAGPHPRRHLRAPRRRGGGAPRHRPTPRDGRDHVTDKQAPPTEHRTPERVNAPSIVIVNTGDGKGKSTAAFGTLVRAIARGWRTGVVQFIKSGEWRVGEERILSELGCDWRSIGDGFSWDSEDLERSAGISRQAWAEAKRRLASGDYDLLVLDEITYPVTWGWIDEDEVVAAIRDRAEHTNVILTGRDASDALIEVANTVTEMKHVKHAYDEGILAKRGIDY